jgi:hypothetical protein
MVIRIMWRIRNHKTVSGYDDLLDHYDLYNLTSMLFKITFPEMINDGWTIYSATQLFIKVATSAKCRYNTLQYSRRVKIVYVCACVFVRM